MLSWLLQKYHFDTKLSKATKRAPLGRVVPTAMLEFSSWCGECNQLASYQGPNYCFWKELSFYFSVSH
jgi:hypothetical protein